MPVNGSEISGTTGISSGDPTYRVANREVTAGEALNTWLASGAATGFGDVSAQIHLFADAVYGFAAPTAALATAGIIVQSGAVALAANTGGKLQRSVDNE